MSGLLDHKGKPLSSFKKAPTPKTGEQYGIWAGDNVSIFQLPGGGAIGFDLNNLTLADFRQMKDHYQINASLSVLTFMLHQTEWHIECENKKIANMCEEMLTEVWSALVRSMAQAFWAGYSPNVLQWENDVEGKRVQLDKIKDLIPEDCKVKWKKVEGTPDSNGIKPKFSIYDGIEQFGATRPIPVDNSYWYPLLMEYGDYYGKKLLRPAFQSWFFSILIHLFANRYYERYGEPVPVGRAPYEDEINVEGKEMKGNQLMQLLMTQLRNRSTVVLPSERTAYGQEQDPKYDYTLEYLESQMRGADFERYLTRLDEEMSLALFTPILMMRTAEVGSYNLGVGHTQVYLWMLNAITGDWARYINKYILSPMTNFNFSVNAPRPKIRFAKMGKVNTELLRTVVSEMMKAGMGGPDLREMSELTGMTFKEFTTVTAPDAKDAGDTTGEPDDTADGSGANGGDSPRGTAGQVAARLAPQIKKAFKAGTVRDLKPDFGYKKQFEIALKLAGHANPSAATDQYYDKLGSLVTNLASSDDIQSPEMFVRLFGKLAESEADALVA